MGKGAKTKGYIQNVSTGAMKQFLYNPSDFSVNRDINFQVLTAPGVTYPKFQFVSGAEKEISIPIYLYGHKGEPREFINFLNSFLPPEKSSAMFMTPPLMLIAIEFYIKKCILVNFSEKYTAFNEDLSVREVTITLTLKVVN